MTPPVDRLDGPTWACFVVFVLGVCWLFGWLQYRREERDRLRYRVELLRDLDERSKNQ